MRQPCHIRADCCHADWQITLPPARRRLMALTEAAGLAAMMRLPARSPLASSVQSLLAGWLLHICLRAVHGRPGGITTPRCRQPAAVPAPTATADIDDELTAQPTLWQSTGA